MRLAEPSWLILLGTVPLPWLFARSRIRVSWPTLDAFGTVRRRGAALEAAAPFALRGLAIACAVVALARPQSVGGLSRVAGQGVAIVAAFDQSSSMTTADFPSGAGLPKISRIDAAKTTLSRFVKGRPDDLLGLVVFANYPDLTCPPTLDHAFLLDAVRAIRPARAGEDGTNLGDAMVWSLNALNVASPRKKVLVLLTDGRNSPAVPRPTEPEKAAELARSLGVTVHTIAVGTRGGFVRAVEPVTNLPVSAEVDGPDLALLERLAAAGGGQAFVATDTDALGKVFSTIDAMEKSPVRGEVRTRYREEYGPWVAFALALVVIDRTTSAGRLRRLP